MLRRRPQSSSAGADHATSTPRHSDDGRAPASPDNERSKVTPLTDAEYTICTVLLLSIHTVIWGVTVLLVYYVPKFFALTRGREASTVSLLTVVTMLYMLLDHLDLKAPWNHCFLSASSVLTGIVTVALIPSVGTSDVVQVNLCVVMISIVATVYIYRMHRHVFVFNRRSIFAYVLFVATLMWLASQVWTPKRIMVALACTVVMLVETSYEAHRPRWERAQAGKSFMVQFAALYMDIVIFCYTAVMIRCMK
ncbi:membrane protein A40 [Aotine betaherpesvirus 1]|uniref:Membrane protein A40 n=1 Tax=Aotine betaherpesvirus 1 TaxID=50290 RepID=G8XUL8_9BETA|nr:membrane protein A40 [Aotine betaherpesvirus 1]AEV80860.1 membrane protein A40 [Aotine betaherpesvirus 1]